MQSAMVQGLDRTLRLFFYSEFPFVLFFHNQSKKKHDSVLNKVVFVNFPVRSLVDIDAPVKQNFTN